MSRKCRQMGSKSDRRYTWPSLELVNIDPELRKLVEDENKSSTLADRVPLNKNVNFCTCRDKSIVSLRELKFGRRKSKEMESLPELSPTFTPVTDRRHPPYQDPIRSFPRVSSPFQSKFNFLIKKHERRRELKNMKQSVKIGSSFSVSPSKDSSNPHSSLYKVKSISPTGKSDSSGYGMTVTSPSDHYFSSAHSEPSSSLRTCVPDHDQYDQNEYIPSKSCQNSTVSGMMSGINKINGIDRDPSKREIIRTTTGTATGAMSLQFQTGPNGDVRKVITLWQNYYPEGQWGWIVVLCTFVVTVINHGLQLSVASFTLPIIRKFLIQNPEPTLFGWLGAASVGVSLLFSPIWVSICKRKSTRLAAVFGGLVASLGCLFTSFASQFHQLFISYGAFIGIGVGLTRDASSLMVGQYFKRKRELVEIIVVSGSGLGILVMSISIHTAISSLGWRIGLQAITGTLFITFFLGTCYRSASLYHPQRRAILHLKNQKRKVKEKEKREDQPPFLDFTCLRSKTLQILLLSCGLTSFGINTPLFYLAVEYENEMKGDTSGNEVDDFSLVFLHTGVGASWILGCVLFGLIVVQKNQDCRVSKQYLCQMAGVICGISILALTVVEGFNGLIIFSCVYGFSLGGYNYALKVYTYERVRARHFPRAWSFIQSSQAIPLFLGVPLTGFINTHVGSKSGYYVSAISVIIGSGCLFLTDVRRRRLSRKKAQNSSMKTCETLESAQSPKIRRLSFAFPVEQMSPQSKHESGGEGQDGLDPALLAKELTCISEEGIADMDFQDIYFEEWAEYFGADCITSCNKVENCLVSEYEPDYAMLLDRKSRRWSTARPNLAHATSAVAGCIAGLGPAGHNIGSYAASPPPLAGPSNTTTTTTTSPSHTLSPTPQARVQMSAPREIPTFRNHPKSSRPLPSRSITVIEEAEASV